MYRGCPERGRRCQNDKILPSLQNIFMEGFDPLAFQEKIGQFVAARQLSGHHIAIFAWDKTPMTRTRTQTWNRFDAARKLQPMLSSFRIHILSL
jgi:hypothetical protein